MRRQGLWTWISAAAVTGIVTATAGTSLGQVLNLGPQENCRAYFAAPSSGGGCMLTSRNLSVVGATTVDWTKLSNKCTNFTPENPVADPMNPASSTRKQVKCVPEGATVTLTVTLNSQKNSCSIIFNTQPCVKISVTAAGRASCRNTCDELAGPARSSPPRGRGPGSGNWWCCGLR